MPSKRLAAPGGSAVSPKDDDEAKLKERLRVEWPRHFAMGSDLATVAEDVGSSLEAVSALYADPAFRERLELSVSVAESRAELNEYKALRIESKFLDETDRLLAAGLLDYADLKTAMRSVSRPIEHAHKVRTAARDEYADLPIINFTISDSLRPGYVPPPGIDPADLPPAVMTMELISPGLDVEGVQPREPAPHGESPPLMFMPDGYEVLPLDAEDGEEVAS